MGDEDFLSRWSRRKRAVVEEETTAPEAAPKPEAEPDTPEEEAALLADLNLPMPESLKPGDDFSAFMADGVPQFLRKRALRVLWRSNPVLANLDGLNDYDDDFRSPELTQKVLATAYQVGRGIVSQMAEPEPSVDLEDVEHTSGENTSTGEQVPGIATEIEAPATSALQEEEADPRLRPRRMRFTHEN